MKPYRGQQGECAQALDALNALDALGEAGRTRLSPRLTSLPRAYDGTQPSAWVAALMWTRPPGYLGYKVLTVFGVWALATAPQTVEIAVGMKRLPFARPFFDPEPYHRLFKRDYTLYYDDDGVPPADAPYRHAYTPNDRLAQRAAVAAALLALFPPAP